MSRSYRKKMWIKDRNPARKEMKRLANKRVRARQRANKDIPNGKKYKRCFCSYDICDYKCRCEFEDFLQWYWVQDKFGDDAQAAYAEWERMYRNK